MDKNSPSSAEQTNLLSEFTEEDIKRLDALVERTGYVSRSALLHEALDFFEKRHRGIRNVRIRVQLDFAEEELKRLGELAKQTGVKSKAEFVRNALRFFEWYVINVKKQSGCNLALKKEGEEYKPVELVF